MPPLRRRLLQGGLPPAPRLRAISRLELLRTLERRSCLLVPLEPLQARAPAVGRFGPAGRQRGGALGISERRAEPAGPQVRERAVAQKHRVVGRQRQCSAVLLVGGAKVAPAEGVVARRLVCERRLCLGRAAHRCMVLRRAAAAAAAELRRVQRSGGRAFCAVLQARWLLETVPAEEPKGVAHAERCTRLTAVPARSATRSRQTCKVSHGGQKHGRHAKL